MLGVVRAPRAPGPRTQPEVIRAIWWGRKTFQPETDVNTAIVFGGQSVFAAQTTTRCAHLLPDIEKPPQSEVNRAIKCMDGQHNTQPEVNRAICAHLFRDIEKLPVLLRPLLSPCQGFETAGGRPLRVD